MKVRSLLVVLVVAMIAACWPVAVPRVEAAPNPPITNFVQVISRVVSLGGAYNPAKPPFNWQTIVRLLWSDNGKITSYGVPYKVFRNGQFVGWFTKIQLLAPVVEGAGRAFNALPLVPYNLCSYRDPYGQPPAFCPPNQY